MPRLGWLPVLVGLAFALPAHAELTPERVAQLKLAQQAARAKVLAEHGNKKESEMDADERMQVANQERQASLSVLEKNGVSDKDFSRRAATLDPGERQQEKAAEKKLKAEAQAKAVAKAKAAQAPKKVEILNGFQDDSGNGDEDASSTGDTTQQVPVTPSHTSSHHHRTRHHRHSRHHRRR